MNEWWLGTIANRKDWEKNGGWLDEGRENGKIERWMDGQMDETLDR